tara:strand:- start:118 stop:477 length:360 start_codon:yes stop_codon:yes gene_type:complete
MFEQNIFKLLLASPIGPVLHCESSISSVVTSSESSSFGIITTTVSCFPLYYSIDLKGLMFMKKKELEVPCLPVSRRWLGQGRENPYTSRENTHVFSFNHAGLGTDQSLTFHSTSQSMTW